MNYAPLVTGAVILAVGLWWLISARHSFTGPRQTIVTDPDNPAAVATAPASP